MELIWIASAYLAGLVATRLGLPPLVGYLVAGYALSALGVQPRHELGELSELGILLLLFTVGLKLKIRSLFKPEVIGVGGLHLLIVAGVSGLIFLLQNQQLTGGLLLGVSLAFSSTVLAVKVLEDNRELSSFQGRTVLGVLIFQDVVAVGLLAVVGAKTPDVRALGLLALPFLRPVAVWLFEITRSDELRLLLGLLMAFAGGELAAQVGISKDLGALLMGLLLAGHAESNELGRFLWGLKEAFLVAFFLQIGLLGAPTSDQLLTAAALLAFLPLQGWLFFTLLLIAGLRARTAFVASLSLTTYSEFALIVSTPLIESGLIENHWKPVLGFALACSLAVGALLNRHAYRIFNALESWLRRFERRVPHPDQLPADLGNAQWLIVGMGRTGRAAYETLENKRLKVMGLDADPVRVNRLKEQGYRVDYGDVEDHELWSYLDFERLQGIILALIDFKVRQLAIDGLRKRGFRGVIGTTSLNAGEDATLYRLGADVIFHPNTEGGVRLAERVLEIQRPEPELAPEIP
ncbi:MAG: cation:proton antiporter [Methylococcus sp.]